MSPMLTNRVAIEPTILHEPADDIPPIVANSLQKGSGGIPRIKQDVVGAAVLAMAGVAEPLESQDMLREAGFVNLLPVNMGFWQASARWSQAGILKLQWGG
jgi:hypothetical protein